MPKFIDAPKMIEAAGNKPKRIEEFAGRLSSEQETVSVARMVSPGGWEEPAQQPEFDEITVVLRGMVRVESEDGVIEVRAGQAIIAYAGERVRYSTPEEGGASTSPFVSPLSHRKRSTGLAISDEGRSMLNWIINRQLDSLERHLGASVDYLRHVARTSKTAYFKFMGFVPMAAHRGGTPRRMLFAARFLATQREDCGTCLQIVVDQATREEVSVEIIQALIDDDLSRLDRETRLAVEFASAVLDNTDEQRTTTGRTEKLRWEKRIVDLSLAIAAARVFPTLKRGLGYAVSCQKVELRVPQIAGANVS